MNLDDFADYRVSIADMCNLYIRHSNCPDRWTMRIELEPPFSETNLKWLMLQATSHWQEAHRQDQ